MKNLINKRARILLTSAAVALTMAAPVKADTHGCTVLLCLASTTINPMSIPECVPDLIQFWSDLWHGNIASCPEAGPGNGFSNMVYEEFLPCPNGSVDLAPGMHWDNSTGTQFMSYGSAYFQGTPYRSCGTNYLGTVDIGSGHSPVYVPSYGSIQTMPTKPNPWYFNVMVNGSINNVIR